MWNEMKDLSQKFKTAKLTVKIGMGVVVLFILGVGVALIAPHARHFLRAFPHNNHGVWPTGPALVPSAAQTIESRNGAVSAAADAMMGEPLAHRTKLWEAPPFEDKKTIRQAWMTVKSENCEQSLRQSLRIARNFDAEVFSMDSRNQERGGSQVNVTFLVPPDRLDDLMAGLAEIGAVQSQRVQNQDVTEQYVDLKGQLANAQQVRERLVSLLNTGTGKLKDILEVERELARVSGTIESLKGRIRYLDSRADRSRLEIHLFEPSATPSAAKNPFLASLCRAGNRFLGVFTGTASAMLAFLGFSLGIGIYLGLIWGGFILFRKILRTPNKKGESLNQRSRR